MARHIVATTDTSMYLMTFFEADAVVDAENLYISRTPIDQYSKTTMADGSLYHDRKDKGTPVLCVDLTMGQFYTDYGSLWMHAAKEAMRPKVGDRQPVGFIEIDEGIMENMLIALARNNNVRFDKRGVDAE